MTYKLTNFIFTRMFKMTAWVYLTLFFTEFCLFSTESASFTRFEQLLEKAGVGTIFLVSYLLVLVIFTVVLAGFYTGSKSMYSIVSLPVKSGKILFALVFPCVVNMTLLFFVQFLTIVIIGKWYVLAYGEPMSSFLLLAFIRYKPISLLFPFSLLQVCRTLLVAIVPAVVILFAFFSATARKYGNFVLAAICAISILLSYSMQNEAYTVSLMILPFILCTFMLCLAGKYIKRRTVV